MASTKYCDTIEENKYHYLASANSYKPATDACYDKHYEHSSSNPLGQYSQYGHQAQYGSHTHKDHGSLGFLSRKPVTDAYYNKPYEHSSSKTSGQYSQYDHQAHYGSHTHKEHGAEEFLSHSAYGNHTEHSDYYSSGAAHGNKCMTGKDEYTRKAKCGIKKRSKEGRCSDDCSSGSESD